MAKEEKNEIMQSKTLNKKAQPLMKYFIIVLLIIKNYS